MLSSSKILLRVFELEDSELIRSWRFDFDNYDYFYEFVPQSKFSNEEWFKGILKKQNEINFVIEDVESKKPAGMISLINIDYRNQKCEMGRVLIANKDYRGLGFGKEAIRLLLEYAFNHLNMNKVYCEVFEDNNPAINAYKKSGFESAGVLKSHIYKNGSFKNVLIMEKLK